MRPVDLEAVMGSFWGDITAAKNRCARIVVKARAGAAGRR
jgi:hypothetical protein